MPDTKRSRSNFSDPVAEGNDILRDLSRIHASPFLGRPDDDARRWLWLFETAYTPAECTDDAKLRFAVSLLHDSALSWYYEFAEKFKQKSSASDKDSQSLDSPSWDDFRAAFLERFDSPDSLPHWQQRLLDFRQGRLSVREHTDKFFTLVRRAGFTPQNSLEIYVRSLNPEIRKRFFETPLTIERAVQLAKQHEIKDSFLRTSQSNRQNFSSSVQCYKCKELGHYANRCPTSQRNQNGKPQPNKYRNVPDNPSSFQRLPTHSNNINANKEPKVQKSFLYQLDEGIDLLKLKTIIDSGGSCSIIAHRVAVAAKLSIDHSATTRLVASNSQKFDAPVIRDVRLKLGAFSFTLPLVCVIDVEDIDCLLGMDFLRLIKPSIDLAENTLRIRSGPKTFRFQIEDGNCCRIISDLSNPTLRASENTILPPKSESVVKATTTSLVEDKWMYITPCSDQHSFFTAYGVTDKPSINQNVLLYNPSNAPLQINKGQKLAIGYPQDPGEILQTSPLLANSKPVESNEINDIQRTQIHKWTEHLPSEYQTALKSLLTKHVNIFSWNDNDLGSTSIVEHAIPTKTDKPVFRRRYRTSAREDAILDDWVAIMLRTNQIRPSSSPNNAPTVIVWKKNGDPRVVHDYRALNEITIKDAYPMQRIDELHESLGHKYFYSSLDFKGMFHQFRIRESDKWKTSFSTKQGHYEYNVMPFGLTGAPATCQRGMSQIVSSIGWNRAQVYMDDVITAHDSFQDHTQTLSELFSAFSHYGVKLNPTKCYFAQSTIECLGHTLSKDGLSPNPSKVKAVQQFPKPNNIKELQSFLGLSGYYRRFIQDYARKASPLTQLLRKGVKYKWTPECQNAFQTLKDALCAQPVLVLPNSTGKFVLHTDASHLAISAILHQIQNDGTERVIAYASRKLQPAERNYGITELECLAVFYGIKYFRCFLDGTQFTVITDHSALTWLKSHKDPTSRIMRWILKLQDHTYDIVHRAGKIHQNADALSRAVSISDQTQAKF